MRPTNKTRWVKIQLASSRHKPAPNWKHVQVRVMATAEGYAMVRRHGCVPFIVEESRLLDKAPEVKP